MAKYSELTVQADAVPKLTVVDMLCCHAEVETGIAQSHEVPELLRYQTPQPDN